MNRTSLPQSTDVAILGGGLAGLTLALQLRDRMPEVQITVLERLELPVPEAAHKVGESTVEIGAHYFAEVIGLRDHLENDQLRKYGLRFFFDAGDCDDLAEATELGASHLLTVPSYQVDRGILENHLADRARDAGVMLVDGARVTNVEFSGDGRPHQVAFRRSEGEFSLASHWVVDAMSRGSVIKRRKGLADANGHGCSAVWFRIDDRIDLARWSADPVWQERCSQLPRWLSTNHLMGPGYWVWLIPLSSGSTSVGVVFDNALHDFDQLKHWQGCLDWLARHQPRCRQAVDECNGKLLDFRYLRNFSHGCRQVYSGERWALTGEAGVFLDPFYSPGSDFIAISNTLVADLIQRERAGENITRRARLYERNYFSFYQSSLALYRDQYPLFGHARAMSCKTVWDYAYYWSVLAFLFFAGRITDIEFIARHGTMLDGLRRLNDEMQRLFRSWAEHDPGERGGGLFVNQSRIDVLVRLNRQLTELEAATDLDDRLIANGRMLEELAGALRGLAPAEIAGVVSRHREPADPDALLAGLPPEMRTATA